MKVDLNEFRKRAEFIACRKHPTLDLLIWNYKPECQFARAWDEYTRMARGLITDLEGNIVARPFPKFFNLGETAETQIASLPGETPRVYEKMDGSLGILYWDGDKPAIATRGSFDSEQARWATAWIRRPIRERLNRLYREGWTYLFEIIYPENRIVVDYGGWRRLVLLAVVNNEDASELDCRDEGERLWLDAVTEYDFEGYDALTEKCKGLTSAEEGFVLKYSNGLRVKVKGDEYVRLHKLITQCSTIAIWEALRAGKALDLEGVPDEFYSWVKEQSDCLTSKHKAIAAAGALAWNDVRSLPTRKDQALAVTAKHKDLSDLVFGLLDGRDISDNIWKRVRPQFALAQSAYRADS